MKLNSLKLTDFRGFSEVNIELNGMSTVLFGANGTGKSSVIRSINLLYANIINKIVNRKELRQRYNIELDDIRYRRSYAEILGEFAIHSGGVDTISYERGMERKTGKRTHLKKNLDLIVNSIQNAYNDGECQGSVPVFVNYGTNRLVLDIPLRIKTHHDFDVYSTYERAIENRIDFRTFFEWYRNQEDAENATKVETKDLEYIDKSLDAVRSAIMAMLPEVGSIHIARKPRLAMMVEKNGIGLNISQLSDGEKCVLAMFGDLAKRLALANPNMDNPLLGEGVVLIDEIELHMHPTWQRKILKVLRETFPNIQFIITTHSPIVLSESDDSYNVKIMKNSDGEAVVSDFCRLDGYDINYILEEFMDTKSRNEQTESYIRDMYSAINEGQYTKAQLYIGKLKELTDDDNEDVIRAEMLMYKKGMIE